MTVPRFRLAAINFTHFHMGDNLRMACEHPAVELVGICDTDPSRMADAIRRWQISPSLVFSDYRQCLEQTRPDVVLLCPSTAEHAWWTCRVAEFGAHVLIEKPFADSVSSAHTMIEAMRTAGRQLAVNWPMAWYPTNRTAQRLIDEGRIGPVREVHYYDGNRGPLWHGAAKQERTAADVAREKPQSWFYQQRHGGGSLLDYLGYGVTLGSSFLQGQTPREITCLVDQPPGLEVDEQSVAVVRYDSGLSTFQTRWGTFTDPWTHQPQPACGFVIVGTEGTIGSFDFAPTIRVQDTRTPQGIDVPVDRLEPPYQNPVQYMLHCLQYQEPIAGPLSIETSLLGQRLVDAARESAQTGRRVML